MDREGKGRLQRNSEGRRNTGSKEIKEIEKGNNETDKGRRGRKQESTESKRAEGRKRRVMKRIKEEGAESEQDYTLSCNENRDGKDKREIMLTCTSLQHLSLNQLYNEPREKSTGVCLAECGCGCGYLR